MSCGADTREIFCFTLTATEADEQDGFAGVGLPAMTSHPSRGIF
jgi:hypothetical protein